MQILVGTFLDLEMSSTLGVLKEMKFISRPDKDGSLKLFLVGTEKEFRITVLSQTDFVPGKSNKKLGHKREFHQKYCKTCAYCGSEFSLENKDCFDHVVPRSMGGLTNDYNLVLCCSSCNETKDDKSLLGFLFELNI